MAEVVELNINTALDEVQRLADAVAEEVDALDEKLTPFLKGQSSDTVSPPLKDVPENISQVARRIYGIANTLEDTLTKLRVINKRVDA